MKSTQIASAILIATILSTSLVSANHHGEMKAEREEMKKEYKSDIDSMNMENREDMMKNHKMMMSERNAKMAKMVVIMKPYLEALPQETQDKISELRAEKKAKMAEKMEKHEKMMEEMKTMSKEEFTEHKKEMKEKREAKKEEDMKNKKAHFAKIREIV